MGGSKLFWAGEFYGFFQNNDRDTRVFQLFSARS